MARDGWHFPNFRPIFSTKNGARYDPQSGKTSVEWNQEINAEYNCLDCYKSFHNLDELKTHERTHTLDKIDNVTFCENFASISDLNKHDWTHEGEKAFSCKDCNKKFVLSPIMIY